MSLYARDHPSRGGADRREGAGGFEPAGDRAPGGRYGAGHLLPLRRPRRGATGGRRQHVPQTSPTICVARAATTRTRGSSRALYRAYTQFGKQLAQEYAKMFSPAQIRASAARRETIEHARRRGVRNPVGRRACGGVDASCRRRFAVWVALHGYVGLHAAAPDFPWPKGDTLLNTLIDRLARLSWEIRMTVDMDAAFTARFLGLAFQLHAPGRTWQRRCQEQNKTTNHDRGDGAVDGRRGRRDRTAVGLAWTQWRTSSP